MAYPVVFDIEQPPRFSREQLAIRVLAIVVLAVLAGAIGWIYAVAYLGFPIAAAIIVSQKGGARYISENGADVTKWLRLLLALACYIHLLTDRFPNMDPTETMTFEVTPSGEPTAGGALLRILTAIPSAIGLVLLSIVASIVWVVAAIAVLVQETYPPELYNFIRGVIRWEARLLGYMAALVEEYPPFSLDTGREA